MRLEIENQNGDADALSPRNLTTGAYWFCLRCVHSNSHGVSRQPKQLGRPAFRPAVRAAGINDATVRVRLSGIPTAAVAGG